MVDWREEKIGKATHWYSPAFLNSPENLEGVHFPGVKQACVSLQFVFVFCILYFVFFFRRYFISRFEKKKKKNFFDTFFIFFFFFFWFFLFVFTGKMC